MNHYLFKSADSESKAPKEIFEWWKKLCPEEEHDNIECSGKLLLLFSILSDCCACGDKLLVFSQSLLTLDVIEKFLAMVTENKIQTNSNAQFSGQWLKGFDYFRLDGSTNIESRTSQCKMFNDVANKRARFAS